MEGNNEEFIKKENNLKKGIVILVLIPLFLMLGYFAGQALFHFLH